MCPIFLIYPICMIKYIIYECIIIHNNITTKSGTCGAVSGDRGTLRFPYGSYNENLRQWCLLKKKNHD